MLTALDVNAAARQYTYQSTGRTERQLVVDMTEMWVRLIEHIRTDRAGSSWTRIVFECWAGQGFVLAYPERRGEPRKQRVPQVIIGMEFLDDVIERTTEGVSQGMSDEEIENQFLLARNKACGVIKRAYRKEPARKAMTQFREDYDFKCFTMDDDDVETLMEFHIIL